MTNLAHILESRADGWPDRAGLILEDGRTWTFRELDHLASAVADAMETRGVAARDRVALFLPNGLELVVLLFASWKLGAVPATLSPLYNATELRRSHGKIAPRLTIAADARAPVAADLPNVVGTRDLPLDARTAPAGPRRGPDVVDGDEAVILFTGGTTGEPKAVRLTHDGVGDALDTLARASRGGAEPPYDMVPESTGPNLVALPLFHSGGQHSFLFAWHVGRPVVLMERFRVEALGDQVARHGIDNLFLMPTMVYDLAHHDGPLALDSLRSVLVAGQALDPTVRRRFEERFDVPILSNYGSTEIGHVAGWTSSDLREGRWKPGAAGRLYDGVVIEIRDDDGNALPAGEPGEICVRGGVARGYVDTDREELVDDGWIASGDIGYLDEDDVLFLVGRRREMIKCGGFQIWPTELEAELRTHPEVLDVAVTGVPDDRMGEIPKAFVVPRGEREGLADDLVAHCRDRLAHFKMIRAVEFVDQIPRSEAGKVRRGDLVHG